MMSKFRGKSWIHLCLAVVVSSALLAGVSLPLGTLPSVGTLLNPAQGVFAAAATQPVAQTETLRLAGIKQPVTVLFEQDGTPHIKASNSHDAYQAIGYLQANNRLFQMDLLRRQGRGLLAEVLGPSSLESDKFQRQVGLTQRADVEWKNLPTDSEVRDMLEAFSQGVNQVIDENRRDNEFPMLFKLLGYEPKQWTPEDTLVINGVMTQMLSMSITPIYNSILADHMGYDRMMELYPVMPPTQQHPFSTASTTQGSWMPMPISGEQVMSSSTTSQTAEPASSSAATSSSAQDLFQKGLAAAELAIMEQVSNLSPYAIHKDSNSNAWVVDGSKTASGKPILAGDPHLSTTLPSIWYQMDVKAPGLNYQGVAVPGIPLILIGRNDNVTWTITNGQNQQTFYYKEQMDDTHPGQYFYKGEWRSFSHREETIPVKGQAPQKIVVDSSVHGPIVTREGATLVMNWTGAIPSNSLQTLLRLSRAQDAQAFRGVLNDWRTPILNFVYDDTKGNIGITGAGLYPVFAGGNPWMVMSGTGDQDIIGAIPPEQWPQSFNPDSHFLASANQRQVGKDYPYYIGTAWYFDPGYRTNRIVDELSKKDKITAEDMAALQNDTQDDLAKQLLPNMLEALKNESLTDQEKAVFKTLSVWDTDMKASSTGATMWWVFWDRYLHGTFDAWWDYYKIPYKEHDDLAVQPFQATLTEKLAQWTLENPKNAYFSTPDGKKRDANEVIVEAFHDAVKKLNDQLGADTNKWTWDRWHVREIPSLTNLPALGYGPKGAQGDLFTLNAAGVTHSKHGPSWRMVSDASNGVMIGIYPGGQSENPLSPWYKDRIEDWWNGNYRPVRSFADVQGDLSHTVWTLNP